MPQPPQQPPLASPHQNAAASFVRTEAAALTALAVRLDSTMRPGVEQALTLLETCTSASHRVIVTGIGKSGLIARKIAATLRSTGTPAHFLHPSEALHGDLGMIAPGDVLLALSYSGETEELLRLLPALDRLASDRLGPDRIGPDRIGSDRIGSDRIGSDRIGPDRIGSDPISPDRVPVQVIALCGCLTSTLARASSVALDVSVSAEACSLNLAPTASTTVMLALGDALALELSRRRGFQSHHFADLHPGGRLGFRLARVRDLMHGGDALPRVAPHTPMPQVIYEMSRKKLGMTTVLTERNRLAGIISDGDLRRLLERDGSRSLDHTAGDIMNAHPLTIGPEAFASDALAQMEQRKVTSLVVVESNQVQGVVHLHDLWETNP
jgi:arabinose-5-phosphate isomerase